MPPAPPDSRWTTSRLYRTGVRFANGEVGVLTSVRTVARVSKLTEERLDSLYVAEDFGAEKTMRARVIRELIDEIRLLRRELANASSSIPPPAHRT